MQANLQKDTTLTKIFVGGLPYHTTDESLRVFFSKFGEIDEAVVITDRTTGKSRGYGFVTMERREDAEEAVREPNPTIDGRRANVNLAYLGAKQRSTTTSLGYGLLTQMPPYQSPTNAYPSPNVVYYPLATPQSSLPQPIYLNAGNTWPTNLLSQLNVTNTSTSSGQTIYEFPAAIFDNPSSVGQQIYWPSYN